MNHKASVQNSRRWLRHNRIIPGTTRATQTPAERAFIDQCEKQGLWPVATTPEGDGIAMWRGHMYWSPSQMPSRLARTTIRGAMKIYRWMLDNCERVTTHEFGDDTTYAANWQFRWMKIGFNPGCTPIQQPIVT